jgi:hypothetical protein
MSLLRNCQEMARVHKIVILSVPLSS